MLKNRLLTSSLFVVGLIILGIMFGIYTSDYYNRDNRPGIPGLLWPNPKQLHDFRTLDQHRENFDLQRLRQNWSLVFFGYTHCPDVCPLTMSILSEVYSTLRQEDQVDNLQVIFVSVDPERDTSEQLTGYLEYYNPGFIGLGGDPEREDSLVRQIGIAWFLHDRDERGEYLVDHSASVFLIDPDGRLLAVFPAPHDQDTIRERFLKIRDFYRGES